MPLLEGLNEHSTGQPWITWHCFTGTPAMPGALLPGAWIPAARAGSLGSPSASHRSEESVIRSGLSQLLAGVPGCQHEPHWRHRQCGEKSQPAHLGSKHSNVEVCTEPPSPPLWETQKATKEDNIWIQAPKKKKKRARAGICSLYLCTLVHTTISVPYHKHVCFTHLLPRFTYFQCRSGFRTVHPYPLHYIL